MAKEKRRMIDPAIWTDQKFCKLSPEAKLLFIGMISFADDEGRGMAESRDFSSEIFRYDEFLDNKIDKIRSEVVRKMDGSVEVYKVKGRRYYQLYNWKRYQNIREDRFNPSALPPPISDKWLSKCGEFATKCQPNDGIEKKRIDKIRIDKNKEEVCLILKDWNERQSNPIPAFKPENIVNKHGTEKIAGLIKQYGKQNNGFTQFLEALKK